MISNKSMAAIAAGVVVVGLLAAWRAWPVSETVERAVINDIEARAARPVSKEFASGFQPTETAVFASVMPDAQADLAAAVGSLTNAYASGDIDLLQEEFRRSGVALMESEDSPQLAASMRMLDGLLVDPGSVRVTARRDSGKTASASRVMSLMQAGGDGQHFLSMIPDDLPARGPNDVVRPVDQAFDLLDVEMSVLVNPHDDAEAAPTDRVQGLLILTFARAGETSSWVLVGTALMNTPVGFLGGSPPL